MPSGSRGRGTSSRPWRWALQRNVQPRAQRREELQKRVRHRVNLYAPGKAAIETVEEALEAEEAHSNPDGSALLANALMGL